MKWNIKDWHANYYNITAILQQQARVPISSVPILNFFNWFVGLEYTEPASPVIYKNAP